LIQSIVCLECRNLFDSTPQICPFCEHATFVHFEANEDPNSICEELLFSAALVQMGFDQTKLNGSPVSQIPLQMLDELSCAAAGVGVN